MNSGARFLALMVAALGIPIANVAAQETWHSPWAAMVSFLFVAYVALGAAAWSVGGHRGRSAIFILGLCAVLGTAMDIGIHPTLRGYERNLYPLEIAFVAVAIWIPLLAGAALRRFCSRKPEKHVT